MPHGLTALKEELSKDEELKEFLSDGQDDQLIDVIKETVKCTGI